MGRFSMALRGVLPVLFCGLPTCDRRAPPDGQASPRSSAASYDSAAAGAALVDRPYGLHVPKGWDGADPVPLVVLLHGYGAKSGAAYAEALGAGRFADERRVVFAYPDGRIDSRGRRFWNATDACCDFDRSGGDDVRRPDRREGADANTDVAYITWLLDDVAAKLRVDRARVYVMGHSNGGFLAHRLACELSGRLAGAVSIAGAAWRDASRCSPSEPVSVLEIHGDADDIIRYGGGRVFDLDVPPYPSVNDTVSMWVQKQECNSAPEVGAPFDFDEGVDGPETTPLRFLACRRGVGVSLWRESRGSHFIRPSGSGWQAIWEWMLAHPKRY
jgi:polyhydroxybutyrate depolymerase